MMINAAATMDPARKAANGRNCGCVLAGNDMILWSPRNIFCKLVLDFLDFDNKGNIQRMVDSNMGDVNRMGVNIKYATMDSVYRLNPKPSKPATRCSEGTRVNAKAKATS